MFADVEVAGFDFFLGGFDGAGDEGVFDGFVFLHAQFVHDGGDVFRAEQAHEVVFEGEEEARGAGVALTAAAAAELVVDAAALVAFGADDVEAAEGGDAFAEDDVGAAAGHVGGDGDGAALSGLGDYLGLHFVEFGVEDVVFYALLFEDGAEVLGLGDGGGADEDGLALAVAGDDVGDDGFVFGPLGFVDDVGKVFADHRHVGGDDDDVEAVDFAEFLFFGLGGAGHAGEFFVHAEVVLEGDGGEGLALAFDFDAFFGFDGLVEAVGVAAAEHEPAGEFVDDDDFAVFDDVVAVAFHEGVGFEGLVEVVGELDVFVFVEVFDAEGFFGFGDAALGGGDGVGFFVDGKVFVLAQSRDDFGEDVVEVGGFFARAGDDERGAGFVDEDAVDFVDDAVVERALYHLVGVDDHVVAEVVEAVFVVGAVGDVGGVGGFALVEVEAVDDEAHGEAEEAVDFAHPFAVAFSQVVVDGDDVDAFAGEGVEVDGEGGDEGFAFAGAHLGDVAGVEDHAAEELLVEVAHAGGAAGSLAHDGEGFGQQVVEAFAGRETAFELGGLAGQRGVAEFLDVGFEGVDLFHVFHQALDFPLVVVAEQALEEFKQPVSSPLSSHSLPARRAEDGEAAICLS